MKETGATIEFKEMVNFIILMEIYMKENGTEIKRLDMEFILVKTVPDMKVIGKMICNTGKGMKCGKMDRSTMETIGMVRKTEQETINGKINLIIKVSGSKIKYKVWGTMNGQMENNIWVNGTIII